MNLEPYLSENLVFDFVYNQIGMNLWRELCQS